jgi:hypothetical protein
MSEVSVAVLSEVSAAVLSEVSAAVLSEVSAAVLSEVCCRTLTRFTPIDTSHAYRLSELALRVSELRGSGEGWATAL